MSATDQSTGPREPEKIYGAPEAHKETYIMVKWGALPWAPKPRRKNHTIDDLTAVRRVGDPPQTPPIKGAEPCRENGR